MITFAPEMFPDFKAYIGFFTNVKNSPSLHQARENFNSSLINPDLIYSVQHLFCAVNRALFNFENNSMKTNKIVTEVIYCLSPSSHISTALKNFGAREFSQNLLVVTFSPKDIDIIRSAIEGDLTTLDYLSDYTEFSQIIKEFNISAEEINVNSCLSHSIYTRIALKDN